jgi:leucyl-tRNA---protein transferase
MAAQVHFHEVEAPRACSYLPEQQAQLENKVMTEVSLDELDLLLERGWRRFGPVYFRPACTACGACRSVRLPVASFAPTPSQQRALRRSRRFRMSFGRPRVDRQRLALYRAWHQHRERARGWEPSALGAEDYYLQFAYPHPAVHELALHEGDRLVAVGTWDVTSRAMSAVYFFFDPRIARLSPGIAHVLLGLELARARRVPYVYLGYAVSGCASLEYKDGFGPHQVLEGRPGLDQVPTWSEPAVRVVAGPSPRTDTAGSGA